MAEPHAAPYGSWKSPITTDLIVAETTSLGQIVLEGADTYWAEARPSEGGRVVILKRAPDGETAEVNPRPYNARTRVHEYGGGAFLVADGVVYFANYDDQRLYRQDLGQDPQPITPEGDRRYADGVMDRSRSRIICVREDHTDPGTEAVNALVGLDVNGGEPAEVLVSGNDFYAAPRLSPDGRTLAWLTWNHPDMPWDSTELWLAGVQGDGSLGEPQLIAGGGAESICQPEWSPDGVLYFISDRSGWWNLYRWRDRRAEPVLEMAAEFSKPHWVFGAATYGFESASRIVCAYVQQGTWRLARLDIASGGLDPLEIPYSEMGRGDLKVAPGRAVLEMGAPDKPMSLIELDLSTGRTQELKSASAADVDTGYLSTPQPIEFPTGEGLIAFAFFYPPRNRDYSAPSGEKPPLLVKSHGGPTSATGTSLELAIQYWTSRGFAVLDVNYGGSSGYGREYRERLKGCWGIVDVEDCVNGALYLAQQGEVDQNRLAIDGGSAGGYTTLAALTFRDVFKAGASFYGVSDLEALAKDTHKFESRYLDRLIGPYPERRDLYLERSPIQHTQLLSCPLILFQGLEDKIVPPSQAEMMFDAVRRKGIPTAYLAFEGEQHGFRKAETIKRALEAELYFYSKIFKFELAEEVKPIQIENLKNMA
ncbi:MAG: prolyl oligopeptidase family serine peptidase, partial [Dehalococcoidia bacterium]